MKLGIKKWILLGMVAGMVSFAGCSKQEVEDVTLKVGVLNTADSVPLFAAEKDGLYEKNGVKVELVEFSSASDQSKAMEAGGIDAMMTDMIVESLLIKGGCDMKAVMVALGGEIQDGTFMVVASANSPFSTKEGVNGAKIGISEGTMMEFLLDSYCEELGIDESTIEKVNVPSLALRLEMLMEGTDVDCAVLPEPLAQFAVIQGGVAKVNDTELDTNLSQTVIVVSDHFLEKHPDEVQKFVDAYGEAVDYLNENPDAYKSLVLKVANVPEAMQDNYVCPHYSKDIAPQKALVERIQTWMVNKSLLTEAYAYDDLVTDTYIKK